MYNPIGRTLAEVAREKSYYYEVPRNKKDKDWMPKMTLRLSVLKLLWLWKNRKWEKCRHKEKALERYLRKMVR